MKQRRDTPGAVTLAERVSLMLGHAPLCGVGYERACDCGTAGVVAAVAELEQAVREWCRVHRLDADVTDDELNAADAELERMGGMK